MVSVLGVVEREIGSYHLNLPPGLYEPLHPLHDRANVVSLGTGRGHGQGRPLPEILMIYLGDRHVELGADGTAEGLHHVPLLLQRVSAWDA